MLSEILTSLKCNNSFSEKCENVYPHYGFDTPSKMEHDKNSVPVQHNLNVLSSNQAENTTVPTLSVGNGLTLQSACGQSINLFWPFVVF